MVVFPYPKDPKKGFIKRVIGLGGDKIQITNRNLYVNDQLILATLVGVQEADDPPHSKAYGVPTVYEERIGGVSYCVQYLGDKSAVNQGQWVVPQDRVFVIGDNRDNSQDSRHFGAVRRDDIEGKAFKIYWSWDRVSAHVRWERIGESIR